MRAAEGRGDVPARAALAGNPSDGYGGAVLAVAVPEYRARAVAARATKLTVDPPSRLVRATVRRFAQAIEPAARDTAIRWTTSIPRGVGLGGSSAIVIATVRSLLELYDAVLDPDELARFALAVERDDLGIAAGLQDRVAQAYDGLTFMDFGHPERFEPLPSTLLPPFVIAWLPSAAEDSGPVHSDLRDRFERGESAVLEAMAELGRLARKARETLLAGDLDGFARCVDGSFDARRRMMPLHPRHVEMIECARACGASANYTGSGGTVVAVCEDERHRRTVAESLDRLGCGRPS
jgi:glucuronokinase